MSTDWKGYSYESIFVHYEPIPVKINAPSLAEVIIYVLARHHGIPGSVVIDRESVLSFKF